MSSRTRIIVLHKKEVIYKVIFAVFGVALLCLLFLMFSSGQKKEEQQPDTYTAGVYSSSVQLGDQILDVEVSVDADHINAIRFTNLNETVSAMYPLMQPALNDLGEQIVKKQSLDDISYSQDRQYTSMVLLEAIRSALNKATIQAP